jgi:hypothetical protein
MNDTELDTALLHLRASVVESLLRKCGVEADPEQVQDMLAQDSDAQVYETLVRRGKEPSRWRSILRWVEGLRGVRRPM